MAHIFEKKWRSEDVRVTGDVDFSVLLVRERILAGLQKAGFKKPSPIQLVAVPEARFNRDLIVQAKSGTGKTLVFVIRALEKLKKNIFRPQTMIIVPTREIATQVCSVVKAVGSSFHKLTCHSFIGGLPLFEDQEKALTTQIVVGTPGRLKQLIQLKALPTNSIRLLIFDEADELLNGNSFKEDLEDIFMALPDNKQVIATSATYNPKVKKVMSQYLCDPKMVRLNAKHLALLGMVHYACVVTFCPMPIMVYKAKLAILEKILKTVKFAQCLLFCNGIQKTEILYRDVKRWGFSVAYISSAKEQCDRLKAIERLRKFKCKVLVSSDLTSRGIDAENVDLVVNFDLAYRTEIYMHRVGRAGRYGSVGVAISLIDDQEIRNMTRIEKEGSFKTFKLPDPIPADLILNPPEADFVINEPVLENVNGSNDDKCDRLSDNDYDSRKEMNEENDQVKRVSKNCLDIGTNFKCDALNGDVSQKVINGKVVEARDISETSVDGIDNNIQCDVLNGDSKKKNNAKKIKAKRTSKTSISVGVDRHEKFFPKSSAAANVKSHDVITEHIVEEEINIEKVDKDDLALPNNEIRETINFYQQIADKKLQKEHTNDVSVKLTKAKTSALPNDSDQNELTANKFTDKSHTCDTDDNPNNICDKNEKQSTTVEGIINVKSVSQLLCSDADVKINDSEAADEKSKEMHTDDVSESSKPNDIVKNVEDSLVNDEQENNIKSDEALNSMIKTFIDTYESNKDQKSILPEITIDEDNQSTEEYSKKVITTNMINNLKSQKNEFFYKTFKTFQENKDVCSTVSKSEVENKDKNDENDSNADLIIDIENIDTVNTELPEESEFDDKDVLQKCVFESTPRIKNTTKMPTDEAVCDLAIQSKLSRMFQEISDQSDSDYSASNEEMSEAAKQSSTVDSHSSSSISESTSPSSSSESESLSTSSGSEEDSDSETDSFSDTSESDSSSTISSLSEDGESAYHHNYYRTGRQNPSLISGSDIDQTASDRVYHEKYFSGRTSKNYASGKDRSFNPIRHSEDNALYCRRGGNNPPYYCSQTRRGVNNPSYYCYQTRRNEQSAANHSAQFNFSRKHSTCPRSRNLPGNMIRGNRGFATHATPNCFSKKHSCCCKTRNSLSSMFRADQSFIDHVRLSLSSRNHSICHRYRKLPNSMNRGNHNRSEYHTHQRFSRHRHTLSCFMPTEHRCHPNTPDYPCRHGSICEMWYNIFYNQWLYIQRAIH